MARSYPIWNKITSCAYKSSNKSYGVREHNEIDMLVGYGSNHSKSMCIIKQTQKDLGVWRSYRLYVDGKLIKQMYFNKETCKFRKRIPKELKNDFS